MDANNNSPEKKSNLADSAIFVKENVLDKFYNTAQDKGLIRRANKIMDSESEGDGDDTEIIEFRLDCQDIADREIQKVEFEAADPDTKQKKKNAWSNFTGNLVSKVKHQTSENS